MTRVVWNGDTTYEMTFDAHCDAPPAAVYDVLADLSTHLDWGGRRQRRNFRLTALHAEGPARVGAEFTSVGSIPMSSARWEDRSLVVRAEPGEVLEFHTDGVVTWPRGTRTDARWEHRYQIEPDGEGSRVAYRLRRTAITIPPLRMRVPVMRTLTHRVMIPLLCRRGFVNLVETAEQRATTPAQARASEPSPVAGSSPAGQLQAGRLYLIRPDGNVAASLPIDSGHVCDAGLRDALAATTAQLVSARFVTGG